MDLERPVYWSSVNKPLEMGSVKGKSRLGGGGEGRFDMGNTSSGEMTRLVKVLNIEGRV